MKKLLFVLLLVPAIALGQSRYVDVEVWQNGTYVGTVEMQAEYKDDYANGYEVAMDRYIQYLEEKETKERAERQRNALNERLKKLGIGPVPSYMGSAALEGYALARESANRSREQARIQRIADEKYAKELGYSSYAELVRARNKRKADEKVRKAKEKEAKKAARKARPSKKERKAAEIAWEKYKQNEKIRAAEKANNLKLESLRTEVNALFKEGNFKESLLKANELITYEPSAYNYNWRGMIKRNLENYEGSITDYSKAIEIDPLDEVVYINRGRVRFVSSDLEGSIVDFNKAISTKPTFEGYFSRGIARFNLKKYYKAIPDFMSALELNPDENNKADILFYMAKTKYELNDTAGAIEGYNQVLSINPDDSRAKYALLDIKYTPRVEALYDKEGRSDKWLKLRIEMLKEIIKIYPEEISLYRDLLEENIYLRNFEESIKYSVIFLKLSNKQGKEITALDYNQIAVSYRNSKKLYEAISFYNKALEIDPLFPTAIGGLGTTKLYLGDVNGACEEWNKAINLEKLSDNSKQHYSGLITENCKWN